MRHGEVGIIINDGNSRLASLASEFGIVEGGRVEFVVACNPDRSASGRSEMFDVNIGSREDSACVSNYGAPTGLTAQIRF